jgi:hypothetical protein
MQTILRIVLAVFFIGIPFGKPQESNLPKISANELPPEPIPAGACKHSYSGYLETNEHNKARDTNLTSKQIGEYVKQRLGEGYTLALYPQVSGRIFVIETCPVKN